MSMQALLSASADRLRSVLALAPIQCDDSPDGSPKPSAGELFIGVYGLGFRNSDDDPESLDEDYSLGVAITLKAGWTPQDNVGPQLIDAVGTGLYAWAERVRAVIHGDYVGMNAANVLIGASANGFHHPLVFRTCSRALPKGPDWFDAEGQAEAMAGYAVELVFSGARRRQHIESQT